LLRSSKYLLYIKSAALQFTVYCTHSAPPGKALLSSMSGSEDGDESSAALALNSMDISGVAPMSATPAGRGTAASASASLRRTASSVQRRNDIGELMGHEEELERDVVESEQMGIRLAREITHLRERLLKWKHQCSLLEARAEGAEQGGAALQARLGEAAAELTASHREAEKLRLVCAEQEREKGEARKQMQDAAAASAQALQAKDDEIERLRRRVAEAAEETSRCKTQVQSELLRNTNIENDVLGRARSTESRLRARCTRLAQSVSELKAAAHKSECESVEQRGVCEELSTRIAGLKSRGALMEEGETSRLAEITRLQTMLREGSVSLAQCHVEMTEKDRALARAYSAIDELQASVRGSEDQRVSLDRQLRESTQEVTHVRAISGTATHQAEDIVARAKEGERKAQRELAAERYRSEVAVNEANERWAEAQRQLQKDIADQRHQAEETKHALALEVAAARRANEHLTVKDSRALAETRATATEALGRLEAQLEAAGKRAEHFERLYNHAVAKKKRCLENDSTQKLCSLRATGEEIRLLQEELFAASKRVARLEGENKHLAGRAESAERGREGALAEAQQLERSLLVQGKDAKLRQSELMGARIAEMRQQILIANSTLEKVCVWLHLYPRTHPDCDF
jgi:chromosome segregation ATPase